MIKQFILIKARHSAVRHKNNQQLRAGTIHKPAILYILPDSSFKLVIRRRSRFHFFIKFYRFREVISDFLCRYTYFLDSTRTCLRNWAMPERNASKCCNGDESIETRDHIPILLHAKKCTLTVIHPEGDTQWTMDNGQC